MMKIKTNRPAEQPTDGQAMRKKDLAGKADRRTFLAKPMHRQTDHIFRKDGLAALARLIDGPSLESFTIRIDGLTAGKSSPPELATLLQRVRMRSQHVANVLQPNRNALQNYCNAFATCCKSFTTHSNLFAINLQRV